MQVADTIVCMCAWAVDMDEGDEERKINKKTDQVWIVDVISCRHGCVACGHRWWWARMGVKK